MCCHSSGIFYETAANEEKDEEIVEVQSTTVETSNQQTPESDLNLKSTEDEANQNVKSPSENQGTESSPPSEKENISIEIEQTEPVKQVEMEIESISNTDVDLAI